MTKLAAAASTNFYLHEICMEKTLKRNFKFSHVRTPARQHPVQNQRPIHYHCTTYYQLFSLVLQKIDSIFTLK